MSSANPHAPPACPDCGTQLAASLLCCPVCQRLIHTDELKRLAGEAEQATQRGNFPQALEAWRQTLALLPLGSSQHEFIAAKVAAMSAQVDARATVATTSPKDTRAKKTMTGIVAAIIAFLLTKGKFLLLGLTNFNTLFSMFLSIGVYWTAWGWKLAAGIVGCIYVHEMGHIAALRRFGIKATAPMFLPGIGAYVMLKQHPASAVEDSRVGLAGPLWGLGAAAVAYGAYIATGWPFWAAIARVSAWLNLFNLLPIWQFDGGRGFRSLDRSQRFLLVLIMGGMWWVTKEGMLLLLLVVAAFRTFAEQGFMESDRKGFLQYAFLTIALSAMSMIQVPEVAAMP